jgi:hypothetical protein
LEDSKLIHGANTWQSDDGWNWKNESVENVVYIENTKKSKVLQFEIGELLEKIQYRRAIESQSVDHSKKELFFI